MALDRHDEYRLAWDALRAAVLESGGRAWIFRGAHHQDQFLEFVEWRDAADGPAVPDLDRVSAARRALDVGFGSGLADEWEEAPPL